MTTSSFPKLAAPGSGLPGPETFIARKMFGLKCRSGSREAFIESFQHEQRQIESILAQSPEKRRHEPILVPRGRGMEDSSRYWSIWMTLDHLRITNEAFTHFIRELCSDRVPEGEVRTADVKPDPQVDASIEKNFATSCKDLLELLDNCSNLKTAKTYPHPWFGPLDAYRWLALASMHMSIHRKQLAAILERL